MAFLILGTESQFCPECFRGSDNDHLFDGYKHKDGNYYGQSVMWEHDTGTLFIKPCLDSNPTTATHVRFRVYKNGV